MSDEGFGIWDYLATVLAIVFAVCVIALCLGAVLLLVALVCNG